MRIFRASVLDVMLSKPDGIERCMRVAESRRELARPAARRNPPAIVAPIIAGRAEWSEATAVGAETEGRPVKRAAPARRLRGPSTRGRAPEGGRRGSGERPEGAAGDGPEVIYRRRPQA